MGTQQVKSQFFMSYILTSGPVLYTKYCISQTSIVIKAEDLFLFVGPLSESGGLCPRFISQLGITRAAAIETLWHPVIMSAGFGPGYICGIFFCGRRSPTYIYVLVV